MSAVTPVPDFVAIGHLTVDHTAAGTQPGGAAYHAAVTAHRLGLRAAILTSYASDFPAFEVPAGIVVVNVPSSRTTRFELEENAEGRRLRLLDRAVDLEERHLPAEWRTAPLALLCPVIGEVDPVLAGAFPDGALAVAPQGWLRHRGADGVITPEAWEDAELVLPRTQALVVSVEDVEGFEKEAVEWFQLVPVAALTKGRQGAALFVNGEPYHVQPDVAEEVSAIGAGDVFAATLLIEYHRRADPWEAAAAAACMAAASVEARGVGAIPDRAGLEGRLAAYRRRRGG